MSPPVEGLDLPLSEIAPRSGTILAGLAEPRLGVRASEGVDLILEGFLLHHGTPQRVDSTVADHRLLAGDYCFAAGLVRVAETGDLGAIDALSRLIAISTGVVAEGTPEMLPALWRTTASALGSDDDAREGLGEAIDRILSGAGAGDAVDDPVDRRLREAFG